MKKIIIFSICLIIALGTLNFAIPKAKATNQYNVAYMPTSDSWVLANNRWQFCGGTATSYNNLVTTSLGGTFSINGHSLANGNFVSLYYTTSGKTTLCGAEAHNFSPTYIPPLPGTYAVTIHITWGGAYAGSWNWEGNLSYGSNGYVTGGETTYPPLLATISGPTSVDLVTAGTWTANISGGLPPYTTAWEWGKFPPQWIGYQTSTSLTQVLTAGNWTIQALINDSRGTNIIASISVTAGTVAGAYTAHLTRSGALGNIIDIYVTDVANNNVTISSTTATKLGYFTGDGAYHLDNAIAEAAQYITYTWRWTTQIAIPPDMWFFSSIHLAVPNIDLAITHHFLTFNDGAVIVFGPTGDPTVPIEIPPAPDSELNPLVQMFYDMLVKLFNYLFKPDNTEFSKQISGGWLNFESPIPSITPSYTIALPKFALIEGKPGVISNNFSFAWIKDVAGFSTVQTIIHAVAYALLVYIAFTIFM